MIVINNPYHLSVISQLVRILHDAPIFYLVDRIRQLFPEYRDPVLVESLIKQIDSIHLNINQ